MKRFLLLCLLATLTLNSPIGSTKAFAMQQGCGCGGAGPTCQTNQRVMFAVLTVIGGYYHFQVLSPIAKATSLPWAVYTAGYVVPAAGIYAGYRWWNQESEKSK